MFVASMDASGQPTCSYKGRVPGFVRVLDEHTLAFPSYDGNGMFLTLGNTAETQQVGLLFIDFVSPNRVRVHGRARVGADDALLGTWPGAQLGGAGGGDPGLPELPALHPPASRRSSGPTSCPGARSRRPCRTGSGRSGPTTRCPSTTRPAPAEAYGAPRSPADSAMVRSPSRAAASPLASSPGRAGRTVDVGLPLDLSHPGLGVGDQLCAAVRRSAAM